MLSRRALLALLPGAVVLRARDVLAQRSAGPARIGWLSYIGQPDPGLETLPEGLRELGYVEGKSFVIVPRFADGDFTKLPRLVDELGAERLDVLVSRGPSVDYTKPIRARVPVVFAYSGDPVAAGFADSLARPGRNMTGITFMALELSAKRMEVLKERCRGPRGSRCCRTPSTPESSTSTGSPTRPRARPEPRSRATWRGGPPSCSRCTARSAPRDPTR